MMLKQIAAVGVGLTVWFMACFLSTTLLIEFQALPHGSDTPIHEPESLLALLVCAVLSSLVAGYACAACHPISLQPALILAWVLIAVGAVIQANTFERTPLWYHVASLSLLLPMCLFGARLHGTGMPTAPQHQFGPD